MTGFSVVFLALEVKVIGFHIGQVFLSAVLCFLVSDLFALPKLVREYNAMLLEVLGKYGTRCGNSGLRKGKRGRRWAHPVETEFVVVWIDDVRYVTGPSRQHVFGQPAL